LVEASFGGKVDRKDNIELGNRIKQIISAIELVRTFISCECARVRNFPRGNVLDNLPVLFSLLGFGIRVIVLVSKQLGFPLRRKSAVARIRPA
jgi:hypothetical protein